MSERIGRAVEVASIVVIGVCILVFGWALLQNVARFHLLSAVLLVLIAGLQLAAFRRNFALGGPSARVRATRDLAFFGAACLALVEVLFAQRWAIGACISLVEFALILELFARFAPAPPST